MIPRRSQPTYPAHAGTRRGHPKAFVSGRALFLLIVPILASCVSLQVEPLTRQHFEPRAELAQVEPLESEPARPHVKLARIIATSQSATEDTLRDRILARARQLGADAVVLGKADVLESMGPSPAYQSTMSPAVANSSTISWGPWGWWTPFYLDPWSFMQGGADQTQFTVYLSGIAIRYDGASAGERTP